ncbi:hypothetical protein HQQ81_13975 [Microbacteriaceae bacterium VKM Ac-2854]|nr:hypothetical protein [Microbacteriaceae bacterium VKM Ac-2854]
MKKPLALAALLAASALTLTACSGATEAEPAASAAQTAALEPRVALTYDGGILVLDGTTLDVEADLALAGFNRLNAAGDDSHVLVSTSDGFRVLNAQTPELTDLTFAAPTPGHVVRHGGKTILFSDGTGDTIVFDTDALNDDALPETTVTPALAAHHGVSIQLEDGSLLTTIGTSEGRTGVRALDADGTETARNEECPAVHGEGTVQGEVAVFGCSDGVLIYDDGSFTKVQAEDAYGRAGNMYVSESSPIAFADYNSDPDAEGYTLSEISLVDTVTKTARVIDLPAGIEYTWRDVARGPNDEAVILGTDGALHLLDPESGELGASFPVIDAWQGPAEWQDAYPALVVVGDVAYVTDPAAAAIHTVDLATGAVLASATLPAVPNEIAVVTP